MINTDRQSDVSQEFISQSLLRFNESTPRVITCLDKLSEQQIWQRPNPSSNSVANLVLHLCGNITQYIISSLGGEPDVRRRDEEFSPKEGTSRSELKTLMQSTSDKATGIIASCSEEELLRSRMVQGFEMSGIGIVIHVVEHYSYHTGQISYITKQLLDVDLGYYGELDLNIKNE